MNTFFQRIALLVLCLGSLATFAQKRQTPPPANAALAQPIRVTVDATHAPEKILHSQLQIPVATGAVKLVFPKWIPGEHAPTGPIVDLTGLQFFANGKKRSWRRDLDEIYAFHV